MVAKTTVLFICIHIRVKSIVFADSIKFCDQSSLVILRKVNPEIQVRVLRSGAEVFFLIYIIKYLYKKCPENEASLDMITNTLVTVNDKTFFDPKILSSK